MDLNQNDIVNIETAIAEGGDIWENKLLAEFKKKVKAHYRGINDECCYCRKNFHGEFNMVIDIEHILPKSKFEKLMFTIYNLNIVCKRCNMNVKREKVDFLHDIEQVKINPKDRSLYKFIHPNFDSYSSHIHYRNIVYGQKKLIKYQVVVGSSKGQYTYDFFKLHELEIDNMNQAQGLGEKPQLSHQIPPDIADSLENIFKQL